jgi:cell division protein ZapA
MKNVMYVQIMGHEYPVEANAGDELYVNRLAQLVESKMRELKEESKIIDSYKLAVLTAMNIADDLVRLQDSKGTHSKADDDKTDALLQILDKALATDSRPSGEPVAAR